MLPPCVHCVTLQASSCLLINSSAQGSNYFTMYFKYSSEVLVLYLSNCIYATSTITIMLEAKFVFITPLYLTDSFSYSADSNEDKTSPDNKLGCSIVD